MPNNDLIHTILFKLIDREHRETSAADSLLIRASKASEVRGSTDDAKAWSEERRLAEAGYAMRAALHDTVVRACDLATAIETIIAERASLSAKVAAYRVGNVKDVVPLLRASQNPDHVEAAKLLEYFLRQHPYMGTATPRDFHTHFYSLEPRDRILPDWIGTKSAEEQQRIEEALLAELQQCADLVP